MTTATVNQLETFRDVLYLPDDIVEIRLLKDGCTPKQRWFAASDLSRVADSLMEWNQDGWNVYAGANPRTHVGGSKNDDVLLARTLFVDFDFVALAEIRRRIDEPALPWPTMIVSSGHGFHCYWKLTEPLRNLGLWTLCQQALIAMLDSDPCVHDPARIMRLPGFDNWNEKTHPGLDSMRESAE